MIYTEMNLAYEMCCYIITLCLFMYWWGAENEDTNKIQWNLLWLLPVCLILSPVLLPFAIVILLLCKNF